MRKNIILQFVLMTILLAVIITALSLYNLRNSGIKSAIHNAESISDAVKSGLTAHMINQNMNQSDTFINSISNMKNVEKLWLVRGNLVNKQFGENKNNKPTRDNLDKDVLKAGETLYKLNETFTKTSLRITIPYNAIEQRGIDCLQCHNVPYGSTLGAVSLVLDISDLKQIGLETIYIITLVILLGTITIIYVARRILTPYIKLFSNFGASINQGVSGNFKK